MGLGRPRGSPARRVGIAWDAGTAWARGRLSHAIPTWDFVGLGLRSRENTGVAFRVATKTPWAHEASALGKAK